jgi:valyl-tRNA synthetase
MQLEKVYEPQQVEARWSQWWLESGFFRAPDGRPDPERPVFSLVIPPPNVTGSLHIGHMLEHTQIDVTTRWRRMQGHQTLWLPGTDHAGIATQMVVERHLRESANLTRHDLGREEFERRVWQWKERYGGAIVAQMKRIGDSCDWSRNRFTLDDGLSRAVRETFVRLHEKGLVYRGEYMVNWCPRCHTALSDLEVTHDETPGQLWRIRYPVNGLEGRYAVVATTRPETMLGDTAVAVHPEDGRYRDLHGRTVRLPLMDRDIPIVLDPLADPEFGTGVVKVTPAHDPNDFEAGKRHHLPHVRVIGQDGRMTPEAGPYAGLDRLEARWRVLGDLETLGLLEAATPHLHAIGKCQRCKTVVEPLVSKQWFCRMPPLAAPAIRAVEEGRIRFVPENYAKTYFEWMHNIRDWCLSRQLWWGHRIPAWHCAECGQATVSRTDVAACAHCGSTSVAQDPDVLDTWFSSGLWPFSTLGWPDETPDLKTYYPTTLLITGFDILFFWVARMIMLGLECTGQPPFRTVYIHGLVRDAERQKMSKTRGNTIDPLAVTEEYGTDAVRFALLRGAAPGSDIVLGEERMASSRAFANKIWNAARFVFLQMERLGVEALELEAPGAPIQLPAADGPLPLEDAWIFHRLNDAAARVEKAQENFRYHETSDIVWGFLWDEFCDWYVELKKLRIHQGPGAAAHLDRLLRVFEYALRLLHPVMPFITEELWQRLVAKRPALPASISLAPYPRASAAAENEPAARDFALFQEIVTAARALRADRKLDPKEKLEGCLYPRGEAAARIAATQLPALGALTNTAFTVCAADEPRAAGALRSTPECDIVLRLTGAQSQAMRERLGREIEQLEKVIAGSRRQLDSPSFASKAPAPVVESLRAKLAGYEAQLKRSRASLRMLGQ